LPHLELPGGDRLWYEVVGEGPPLLLVPGLAGVSDFFAPHVRPLARRFRLILHDHRGCGRSSPARIDYSVEQMAGDVVALMDHLGLERAHFLGHSTGGAIGQTLAIDRPERIDRLILCATWTAADGWFRLLFQNRREILEGLGPGAYARVSALFLNAPFWVRLHPEIAAVSEEEARRRIRDPEILIRRIKAILAFDRRAELHRIRAPTLVMGARDDMVTPAYFSEELGRVIPNAETVILPDGGHFFPVAREASFRRHVLRFLGAGGAGEA
jgi:aminoacrylate hydrolase